MKELDLPQLTKYLNFLAILVTQKYHLFGYGIAINPIGLISYQVHLSP